LRLKTVYILAASTLLFWGPSIGSSGMTDAVPTGLEEHRAAFGWQSADAKEAQQLSAFNDDVFELAAADSQSLFSDRNSN
jgi:hypothetical protein